MVYIKIKFSKLKVVNDCLKKTEAKNLQKFRTLKRTYLKIKKKNLI